MIRILSWVGISLFVLAACSSPEEERRKSYINRENGEEIYSFTVEHWPTAFWSEAKLESWIKKDATKLCPQGYHEISRTNKSEHVAYWTPIPTPYRKIEVKIGCPT